MALIRLQDLGQQYKGQYVLKNVNLEIGRGDILALIGPTGAGKTTLMRLLDLLDPPASGRIYFDGVDVTRSGSHQLKARRRMSYVQQKPAVFSMSVYDNVACGLRWRHERDEVVRRRVENVLELVDMADCRTRNAKTLSGGETQRVAIARALATEPEVLLLDEPTANLDPISVLKIEEVLAQVIREQRTTVVMATHDLSQGQRLAGRIGVIMDGEVVQVGSAGEIFVSPQTRQIAEFVGVENILAGVVMEQSEGLVAVSVGGKGDVVQAVSDHEAGEGVHVLLRPDDVTLTLAWEKSSARNVFSGRITRATPVGPLVRVEVDCGFPLLALVTKKSAEELNLTVGTMVYASFKATAVRLIKRLG